MKNILFFMGSMHFWRERLRGIHRYADKAGWHVQVAEYRQSVLSTRNALRFWKPDGCIVDGEYAEHSGFRSADFVRARIPMVFCDAGSNRMRGKFGGVMHDTAQTTMLATRELLDLGMHDYAFVDILQPRKWSRDRMAVMKRLVERAGCRFHCFTPKLAGNHDSFLEQMRFWLDRLPKPCGILGATDLIADLVLHVCRMSSLRVPDDVAVVGIDNDETICNHSVPTLTSVLPDFEQAGYLAARLLDRVLHNPSAPPRVLRFGSAQVIRRNSTVRFQRRDDGVLKAIEHIRLHACDGVTASDVCALIGGSRRQAEYRFRNLVGRSIGEQIRSVRLAAAKRALLRRDFPIEAIHAECGYASPSALRRAFLQETGCSLRAWRCQNRV